MARPLGVQRVLGGARPDRGRRPARLRSRVGGRAPLPRGVLPQLRAGGVLRGGVAAHEADPHLPRRAPAAVQLQPPDQAGRAGRRARHHVERPGRVRHRPLDDVDGARRVRHRLRAHPGRGARVARDHREGVDRGGPRAPRRAAGHPTVAGGPQADPEAAPADVDGLRGARQLRHGRRPRPRRAVVLAELGAGAEGDVEVPEARRRSSPT